MAVPRIPARRSVSRVLACAVLVASAAPPVLAQPTSSCSLDAAGFEGLVEGTEYTVGESLTSGPATLVGEPFTWGDGRTTSDGFARVDPALGMAGGTGLELQVNNIRLAIGFGGPLGSLSLAFGEYGGNVNLVVNGDPRNVDDFSELDGTTVGDVEVTVVEASGRETWTLTADGEIRTFSIGGQELWIDDVAGIPMCPDLTTGDVSHRFVERGRRLEVSVVVQNIGEVATTGTTAVTVTADDWRAARELVPPVDAVASTEVVLALDVPPGQHGRRVDFVVRVDPDGVVRETDDANNLHTIEDLLVPSADLALTVGSTEFVEDHLAIAVVARNQGGLTSRPTTVVTAGAGWPAATEDVPRLAAGQEAELLLEVPIPADRRGETTAFLVTIDPDDVVKREVDESNNTAEVPVDVPMIPDEASDSSDRGPWLPLLLAVIAVAIILSFAALRRWIRRQRGPRPEGMKLELRDEEPDVRVTARADGPPGHTVHIALRSDRAQERIRERTFR